MSSLSNTTRQAVIVWTSVYFCILHLYTAVYGAPEWQLFLTIHLALALTLAFMIKPIGSGMIAKSADFALCAITFAILGYMLVSYDEWDMKIVALNSWDYVTGIALILLVAEAVRRTIGIAILVVAGFFVVYALFSDYFPGFMYGPPASGRAMIVTLYISEFGIFGIPLGVMANYVVLFIIFGTALGFCGVGAFMTRLAFALFGSRVGGPAKAAVVGSGLLGSISGSCIANVLTTGAFTIPMMKRLGYNRDFAGGVETTASTGGMIMPPVMGVTAFMMADFMGVPYTQVVLAAAIPAILYYWGIYWAVHFEAQKKNLPRLPREELPDIWHLLITQGYLGIPLIVLILMLFVGFSILIVALAGILSIFLLSFVRKRTRLTPMRLEAIFEETARNTVSLSAACACAGIIIGSIFSTGLSFELGQRAIAASGGHLWVILVLTAFMAMFLGMGITSSAVYITMVATVVPILVKAGVPEMAAHMFSMYYGVISNITPPVALAAFAAASVARSNPMTTGMQAARIGIAGFVVPFLFVYAPELLFIGDYKMTVWVSFTGLVGLLCAAAGLTGYLLKPTVSWERFALLAAFIFLILADTTTDIIGLSLGAIAVIGNRLRPAKKQIKEKKHKERRVQKGWLQRRMEARIQREEPEPTNVSMGKSLMQDDIIPGGEDEVTRTSLYGGWVLLAAATVVVAILGRMMLHAIAPFWWLALMAIVSFSIVVGLKLILKPASVRSVSY